MWIILLCYLISIVQLFTNRSTIRRHIFDPKRPYTILTSFFVHNIGEHYYYNVVGIFLLSFFIENLFSSNLFDLLLLAVITHVIAVHASYHYYKIGGCGASAVMMSWISICIFTKLSAIQELFPHIPDLAPIMTAIVILFLFLFDLGLNKYRPNLLPIFIQVSHVGHFVGLITGFIYWHFFSTPEMVRKASSWFETNTFWKSSIPLTVNLYIIPFILVYAYKIENPYFLRLDKYLQRWSSKRLKLYDYVYIEVGRSIS